jgi:hypothetical protein
MLFILQTTLVEFMELSKNLLVRSRQKLLSVPDTSTAGSPARDEGEEDVNINNPNAIIAQRMNSGPISRPENTNVIWQSEMERGYDALLDLLIPHISDSTNVNSLKR